MQSRGHDANGNATTYNNEKAGEATQYAQKTSAAAADNNKNHIGKDITSLSDDPETLLLFKNPVGKMPTFDSQGLSNGDSGKGLSASYPVSRSAVTEQNKLGLIDDLVKLGLPRDHIDDGTNLNSGNAYSSQSENPLANPFDSNVVNSNKLVKGSFFDSDIGYTSDTADLNQARYHNGSVSNRATLQVTNTEVNEFPSGYEQHKLLDGTDVTFSPQKELSVESKKSKKGSKDKKVKLKNINSMDNHEQNGDMLPFLTSPFTRHADSDGRQSAKRTPRQRARSDSKSGSPKFIQPSSKPGVLSDDEYIINVSSLHRHGRRSAPIFTKRGFSASEFWNSGQTAIERTHLQDMASSRVQERQKAKSPTTNIFIKFPGKKNDPSVRQIRPRSVEPSSFLNKLKNDHIKQEPVQSGNLSLSGGRGIVNYGSTVDTARDVDHRGYHSELETRDWRLQNPSFFPNWQRPSAKDGFPANERLAQSTELGVSSSLHDGAKYDASMHDSLETTRTHGMRGVFRTPRIVSPRDLQVKVIRGTDAMKISKNNYDYILENEDVDFQKQASASSSDESSEGDSSDDDEDNEKQPSLDKNSISKSGSKLEIKSETRTEVYKRRWYLLFLFSLTALLWNAIWSTWGPIAQSAKVVYGWEDGDIAMFTYLGNIPFLITMFPCAYLMDVTGMRMSMILCCCFMFAGAGFRCLPGDPFTATWFIRIGQWLNGMAGTIPMSGPGLLSSLWFPPHQRATATAISTVAGYFGASISFVIGPLLVPEPGDESPINGTINLFSDDFDTNSSSSNSTSYYAQEQGIRNMLYAECGLAGLLLLLVIIYFPSKPPLPPSISASIPREKYVNGLKLLVRNKQFWICAIAFSVPIGVYESWQVILDINLDSHGISQQTAGWLNFYATVGGCVSGLLVSRFADLFTRQMKLFLLVFYSFATVAILWLTLVVLDIIPFDEVSIYAAVILAGIFLDGGSPLFFELTIEVAYPVGEGVTSAFMHMMCAAAGTVFLVVVQIQNIGTEWMNWCFLGCVALTIPLLMFINTSYARADIDDMEIDISEDEEAVTGIGASDTSEKTSLLKNSSV